MKKPKWEHTMEELDMLNCLFYLNHFFHVVIGIKRGIALYIPASSFSFYTLFFLVTYNDNRTAQIVRIVSILYMISINSTGVSINDLVSKFGVCERTIYRDLDRMEYAGIPIVREDHRIKLIESEASEHLTKKIKKFTADGEIKIKTKPGKMYDVALTFIPFLDSIHSIEPRHLEKWVYAEANRRRKDLKP